MNESLQIIMNDTVPCGSEGRVEGPFQHCGIGLKTSIVLVGSSFKDKVGSGSAFQNIVRAGTGFQNLVGSGFCLILRFEI